MGGVVTEVELASLGGGPATKNDKEQEKPGSWQKRRIGPELTKKDFDILRWIGVHGLVLQEQVARKFYARDGGRIGRSATYARMATLESRGYIIRDHTFWRWGLAVRLTPGGARLANVRVGAARLVLAEAAHSIHLVDLIERLGRQYPDAKITTERQIRAQRMRDLRRGKPVSGKGRICDGLLKFEPATTVVGIELDVTPKWTDDVLAIIDALRWEALDRIWWHCLAGDATRRMQRIVAGARADDFIEVREWQPEPWHRPTPGLSRYFCPVAASQRADDLIEVREWHPAPR